MVKVAIAGGTGGVGQHLVEEIAATGKHEVVVLSRKETDIFPAFVKVVAVDYQDHAKLVSALSGVHTVICAFFMAQTGVDGPNVRNQLALIKAAAEAGVKRYAPSEFGCIVGPNPQATQPEKYVILQELKKYPQFETTLYFNGLFMDYFAGTKNDSHLHHICIYADPQKEEAELPGSGEDPIIFTKVADVGKLVAASLDLDKWPEVSGMCGARVTYNEAIKTYEKVLGKKFKVTYRTKKQVETRTVFLDYISSFIFQGMFDFEPTLNKAVPDVKVTSLEQLIKDYLAG